jgi:hypothetical protein
VLREGGAVALRRAGCGGKHAASVIGAGRFVMPFLGTGRRLARLVRGLSKRSAEVSANEVAVAISIRRVDQALNISCWRASSSASPKLRRTTRVRRRTVSPGESCIASRDRGHALAQLLAGSVE